jgi:beta-galactosidase GanA
VLCTPTATPPAWVMAPLGPESQPHGRDGRPREPGSRRHYCHSSEPFRAACEEIVTAFARRLGGHPAVVAWQTDNESVPSGGRARAAPMHYIEMRNSQKKKKKKKKKTQSQILVPRHGGVVLTVRAARLPGVAVHPLWWGY